MFFLRPFYGKEKTAKKYIKEKNNPSKENRFTPH